MAGEWGGAVLAFVGAGIGSAVTYAAAIRQTRAGERASRQDIGQRREQARHEEWGRRFTHALDGIGSEDARRRATARVLLVHLAKHGGDALEKELALAVLEAGALLEKDGDLLDRVRPGALMDNVRFEEDTEEEQSGDRP